MALTKFDGLPMPLAFGTLTMPALFRKNKKSPVLPSESVKILENSLPWTNPSPNISTITILFTST